MAILCTFFVIVGFVLWLSSSSSGVKAGVSGRLTDPNSPAEYDRLLANGVAARGILLRVSNTRTRTATTTFGQVRLEQRMVTMDIEVPGQKPYELNATPFIPAHLAGDILPGATVELRVDPSDPTRFVVFGPGVGLPASVFAQAQPQAPAQPALPAPAPVPQQSASRAADLMAAFAAVQAPSDQIVAANATQFCRSCGAAANATLARQSGRCPVCGQAWT